MVSIETRKLRKSSESYEITLPKPWVRGMGLKEGAELLVKYNDKIEITVAKKQAPTKK